MIDFLSLLNPTPAPVENPRVGHFQLTELVDEDARAQALAEARRQGGHIASVGDTTSNLGSGLHGASIVIVPQKQYQVGDVVAIPSSQNKGGTVHPVIAVRDGAVYTKGTNNSVGDGWTPLENVEGKVTKGFRNK